jgi:hypothetical protein
MPRRSSADSERSPRRVANTVSASSSMIVGGSATPIERVSAATEQLAVARTFSHTSWRTSRRRVLPQRRTGLLMTSRVACSQQGWTCVAAVYSVTASAASGDGNAT